MAETRFAKGDRVTFEWGLRFVQGVIKEDRGPIGVRGRRLYLIEFPLDSLSESIGEIELPADEFQLIRDPVARH